MLTIKAMTGGETYAAHHLSNNDYYSVGETIDGQWIGRGAELLGLQGKVDLKHFEAIRQGNHPFTGEFLRPRQSADRVVEREVNGKHIVDLQKARNLYDFTISAPKDVSIQAMEDPRLIDAHNVAAAETIQELERLAWSRIRRGGANENRETGNLVIAQYNHDTSRELDPQIHTHFVAGNLTYDGAEGRWKALQASEIYAEREYLTEVYRNRLAREVAQRGYRVEDRFDHGKDNGFGIVGIEEKTREKFSRRSVQRDAAIQDFLENNGRLPSNNEIARLVRETRPEKLTEVTTAAVKAQQRARLDAEEARTLKDLHQTARDTGPVPGQVWERLAALDQEERRIQLDRRGLAYVTRELSERISMPLGERDPYWETWYEAHGRPLEEPTAMGASPKLFAYIDALNERYEAWRTIQVMSDSSN